MSSPSLQLGNFIVLGASGSIGAQVSRRLRQAGHRAFLAAPNSDRLQQLGQELDAPTLDLDATSPDAVDDCFASALQAFERIDGVVNCVGSLLLKPAHLTSEDEWHDTIAKNLTSSFSTVRAAARKMKSSGGSVVLISSAAALVGLASHEAIAAAKAGVIGLARSAAASYASRGLRVNVVAPGLVKSNMTRKIWENERAADASRAMHPLGRLGEPEEVASLICWLLEPANAWVTGEVFSIDGGLAHVKLNQRTSSK